MLGSEKSRSITGKSESLHGPANNEEKNGDRSRTIRCSAYDLSNALMEMSAHTPNKYPLLYKWSSIGFRKGVANVSAEDFGTYRLLATAWDCRRMLGKRGRRIVKFAMRC